MKLWDKGINTDKKIESFTIGKDRELDLYLAPFDVMGTMAHSAMLAEVGLLTQSELETLLPELKKIYQKARQGNFEIEEGVEDVHSQVEMDLTRQLGDTGKKVHSGRSRNDQVLLDLKLFAREKLMEVVHASQSLLMPFSKKVKPIKTIFCPAIRTFRWPCPLPSDCGLGLMQKVLWMICR